MERILSDRCCPMFGHNSDEAILCGLITHCAQPVTHGLIIGTEHYYRNGIPSIGENNERSDRCRSGRNVDPLRMTMLQRLAQQGLRHLLRWQACTRHDGCIGNDVSRRRRGRGAARDADDERANMQEKRPDLPANFLMAAKTVAQSPRKGEWVDISMASGTKLHTWISYPQGVTKAPVVLVFQPGPGMDMGEPPAKGGGANWLRAIADQLAYSGFIAVLPDLTSGLGPNGGNYDSFKFPDDSAAALNKISHAEVLNRIRVARDYGLKLPMANGKLGVTGFCAGGGLAWESAAEIEGVNVSVVFYGAPPAEAVMAKIKAPVAAFFGSNDLGLAPRVAPATADMKRLGKEFDVHVYDGATHVFLYRQDLGKNWAATRDAWPKAIAFFKKYFD